MTQTWTPIHRVPTRKQLRVRLHQYRTDAGLWWQKRRHRRGWPRGRGRPAFVVGCQRSGTDMVLWTLDKSLDVDRFDENHRAAFRDCRIKSETTRRRLISRSTAKCVIFKPVCDSHHTTKLLGADDDARAVWVYRDFRDVANSAVTRWGDMILRYVRDLARGEGNWGRRQWNRELLTPERQAEIESLCDTDLTAHGAFAVFWYLVNQTFFDQQLDRDRRVAIIRYEDLVTTPATAFDHLCAFLGVTFREEMVRMVLAPSAPRPHEAPISPRIGEACAAVQERLDQVRSAGAT